MRLYALVLLQALLCSGSSIAVAADIERNPGSRSGAEHDPYNVVSRSADSGPAANGSTGQYDFSLLTFTLIRSIAKVAAFDFQQAGVAVLDFESETGATRPRFRLDGSVEVRQPGPGVASDDDAGSGILEFQSGALYNESFVLDYQPDDTLDPPPAADEVSYPARPQDSSLERQLEQLAPRVDAWPGVEQDTDGLPLTRAGAVPLIQALESTTAGIPARGLFTATLPATAPVSLQLPAFPPRMPGEPVSSVVRSVARGNPRLRQVALTFDDGPHPEFTSQLLTVLEHYDVKATFFFVGLQSQKHPQWVKMTHQAGHELASQTYDHFRLPKLPLAEKEYQIDEYQRLIEGLVGVTPRFLRPPGGQLDSETEQLLSQRNMVLGMWDVALNDTNEGRTAADMLKTAQQEIRPGSVVLAHDGVQATVDMLPDLIEFLQQQGYEIVTMSELAAGIQR